jgi:hypothetical protein
MSSILQQEKVTSVSDKSWEKGDVFISEGWKRVPSSTLPDMRFVFHEKG